MQKECNWLRQFIANSCYQWQRHLNLSGYMLVTLSSSHGVFCWNPWTGKESIWGFWNLVEVCSAPATIDYSCFCRALKRTICIKNIILWYELEQLQIGFHGVCPAIWPLQGIAVITSGPGQWGRGKAIRWGVVGMHAKEVTLAALIIHPHSQEEGGKFQC